MHLTNKEHYDIYTSNIKSPQRFLDFGYYYMIGAALQRRVWLQSHLKPIVPCMFVILCGEPGVGKGLVIDDIGGLLSHHKFRPLDTQENDVESKIRKAQAAGASDSTILLLRQAQEAMAQIKQAQGNKEKVKEAQLLFPRCADATTYESMVNQHALAVRVQHCSPCPIAPSGIYTYHSINVIIEEASSLFCKQAEKVVQYLLSAFNCSDYTYKTKHFGEDTIRRSSLALLGGTTPEFMRNAYGDRLLGEGFTSRSLFVYGNRNRFENWRIPDHTSEQLASREKVLTRLHELSKLFGQCSLTPSAVEFLDDYFKHKYPADLEAADHKLKHYFVRKNLHVQKLGMAIHFSESDSLEISEYPFMQAMIMLKDIEGPMVHCLTTKTENPVGDLQRKVFKWMKDTDKKDGHSFEEIYMHFVDDFTGEQVKSAMEFLVTARKTVDLVNNKYKIKK